MKLNYHIDECYTKCPYCDYEITETDPALYNNLGTKIIEECENCGKKFRAEANITYSSYGDCNLNGIEHELKETHIKDFFKCDNCEHYERIKKAESK